MKVFWLIMAGACGAVALFFAIRDDYEKAFVTAAVGAVCWFLNYRQQLRQSLAAQDKSEDEEPDDEIRS